LNNLQTAFVNNLLEAPSLDMRTEKRQLSAAFLNSKVMVEYHASEENIELRKGETNGVE
jgi:hypothetical protein